jgi:hypothetical protein
VERGGAAGERHVARTVFILERGARVEHPDWEKGVLANSADVGWMG